MADLDTRYGVYAYVDPNPDKDGNHQVVYIGSDSHIDEDRRDKEHRKPSKCVGKYVPINGEQVWREPQVINVKIQEENLIYVRVALCLDKDIMYVVETNLINKHKPKYNQKMEGWKGGQDA